MSAGAIFETVCFWFLLILIELSHTMLALMRAISGATSCSACSPAAACDCVSASYRLALTAVWLNQERSKCALRGWLLSMDLTSW